MNTANLFKVTALPGHGNGYASRIHAEPDHAGAPQAAWDVRLYLPPCLPHDPASTPALRAFLARSRWLLSLDHADTALALVPEPLPMVDLSRPHAGQPGFVLPCP